MSYEKVKQLYEEVKRKTFRAKPLHKTKEMTKKKNKGNRKKGRHDFQ